MFVCWGEGAGWVEGGGVPDVGWLEVVGLTYGLCGFLRGLMVEWGCWTDIT